MLWKEASRRALRTFIQSLSGALPAVSFGFSKAVWKEVLVAVGGSAWAAFMAFLMNLSPPEPTNPKPVLEG
jgi:hypothetical protein